MKLEEMRKLDQALKSVLEDDYEATKYGYNFRDENWADARKALAVYEAQRMIKTFYYWMLEADGRRKELL